MGLAVISSNQSISISKKFYVATAQAITATPLTIITTGSGEYVDLYTLSVSYVSGPSNNSTLQIKDNDTNEIYYSYSNFPTANLSVSVNTTEVSVIRMTPNSTMTMRNTNSNTGNYNFSIRGISYINSP